MTTWISSTLSPLHAFCPVKSLGIHNRTFTLLHATCSQSHPYTCSLKIKTNCTILVSATLTDFLIMELFTILTLAALYHTSPLTLLNLLLFELLQEIFQYLLDDQSSALSFAAANSVICWATLSYPFVAISCLVACVSPSIPPKFFVLSSRKSSIATTVACVHFHSD